MPRLSFQRALAEFLVIFLGVTLGLVADDWRQRRAESADANEALSLILEDLSNDSTELASLRPPLVRHVQWTSWLDVRWREAAEMPDSLGLALRSYLFTNSPQLQAAAYSSLKDGERVGLIRDAALRDQLVGYYEDSHVRLNQYFGAQQEQRLKLLDVLYPHVLFPGGREPGSIWPPRADPATVSSSWTELRSDNAVLNQALAVGAFAELTLRFIDEAQERNRSLRTSIERELEAGSR